MNAVGFECSSVKDALPGYDRTGGSALNVSKSPSSVPLISPSLIMTSELALAANTRRDGRGEHCDRQAAGEFPNSRLSGHGAQSRSARFLRST
jgi:hypothetical protein